MRASRRSTGGLRKILRNRLLSSGQGFADTPRDDRSNHARAANAEDLCNRQNLYAIDPYTFRLGAPSLSQALAERIKVQVSP